MRINLLHFMADVVVVTCLSEGWCKAKDIALKGIAPGGGVDVQSINIYTQSTPSVASGDYLGRVIRPFSIASHNSKLQDDVIII